MATVMKNCLVCGKEYPACAFCDSQNEFLAWRSVVCTQEHFAYHIPIIRYIRKQISKEQAKTDLLNAEKMYGELEYADDIKNIVAEIKGADEIQSEVEQTEEVATPKKKRTRKSKSIDE